MQIRRVARWVAGAVLGASVLLGSAEAQDKHNWKIQSLWQAGSVNQKVFEDWAARVKTITNGRLTIEPLPVGTIVAYGETLDAITNGILDGHHSGGPYF